jgi:hypothetical protein
VAAIKKAGGSVGYSWEYEWEWRDGNSIEGGEPWAPRWLEDLIEVDYFGHVTVVELPASASATDATLADVGRLTRLHIVIEVYSPSVSDAGLAHVKGLTKLRHLRLNGTRVTDAGPVHLKGLSNLSVLGLSRTQVTDAVLVHLKGLTKLERLALITTGVTDAGVKELDAGLGHLGVSLAGRIGGQAQIKPDAARENRARQSGLAIVESAKPSPRLKILSKPL